jgi:hypothetical protein
MRFASAPNVAIAESAFTPAFANASGVVTTTAASSMSTADRSTPAAVIRSRKAAHGAASDTAFASWFG